MFFFFSTFWSNLEFCIIIKGASMLVKGNLLFDSLLALMLLYRDKCAKIKFLKTQLALN